MDLQARKTREKGAESCGKNFWRRKVVGKRGVKVLAGEREKKVLFGELLQEKKIGKKESQKGEKCGATTQ